jgi:RNA polymerase sigma-70 factor (ECF subfamily)
VGEFERLLREHDPAMRRLAYRLVGGDVDDVLQMAYLSAFRAWSQFRGESSVATWLHQIVFRTAMNHLRRRRRATRRERGASPRVEDHAGGVASRLDLAAALDRLPVDQRAAVLLVDGEGLSYRDAARVVGTEPGTIASRLNRAHRRIRHELDKGSRDG